MRPRNSPVALVLSLCAALVASAAAVLWFPGGSGRAAGPPIGVPAAPAGWTTVFGDGFQGQAGSAPSSRTWIHDVGAGSRLAGNVLTYTNSTANVSLDGHGDLVITALKTNGSWTSGRVHSAAEVTAPAGGELEVTASIEQPSVAAGLGYWPAFWLLGPGRWPGTGEVDILEAVNAFPDVSGTLHCGVDPGGPCKEPKGIGSGLVACPGCGNGFHTYSVLIDRRTAGAESMTWSVDGRYFFQVSEHQVPAATWQQAVDHGFSVIFNLAIGGKYPDSTCRCTTPTDATSSGGSLTIAYVAAYAKQG